MEDLKEDVAEFIDDCTDCLLDIADLPHSCNAAGSWKDTVTAMRKWAGDENHATEKMKDALANIHAGVSRWL